MAKQDCAAVQKAIETRSFVGWAGLPGDCTEHDLFVGALPALPDEPNRRLGDEARPATAVLLDLSGYYRPLLSFRDGKVVLFDGMNPELAGSVVALQADLGQPAARFGWFFGTLEIPNGEWVYPARGITLFLNKSAEDALHIALYQPTSLEVYQASLRPPLRKTLNPKGPVY